jgi:hypothetical protein
MPETLIGKVVRRQSWLDPVSDFIQKLGKAAYRSLGPAGPPVRNLMHGTWLLRHPLHPAVTDVPIGAWTACGGRLRRAFHQSHPRSSR